MSAMGTNGSSLPTSSSTGQADGAVTKSMASPMVGLCQCSGIRIMP